MTTVPLPIEPLLPRLRQTLAARNAAVLEAPPGAGKTTLVPLALLDEPWLAGQRIVMLEPRRLAARAAAARMAALLGEPVGGRVGYRTRLDSKIGPQTRIEVATEGILTRRLQSDPGLEGVGLVIFDEFHERSLQADLGLALCLELQALREELRLLLMSATLDGAAVAALLGEAPRLSSAGRSFPVELRYLGRPKDRLEPAVATAARRALAEAPGDLLVFLPGEAEIRRCERLLETLSPEAEVIPLFGALTGERQDAALRPAPPGRRKVVLATAIAETSLTIEGVRVVVDAGLSRRARFDPASGMSRLETGPVSRAAAEQRRGRAGRTAPGICYRLWSEPEDRALPAFERPEILDADLAPLALELTAWGAEDAGSLAWLDPPPAAALVQARDLLQALGALDAAGRITGHGRRMAELGAHPRLAHMLLAAEGGDRLLACELAALLSERDLLKGGRDADLRLRVELLRHGAGAGLPAGARLDEGLRRRCLRAAADWRRRLRSSGAAAPAEAVGRLLAMAYPERLAQRRGERPGAFRLASGRGALLPESDPLAAANWLAVGTLDAAERDARIFLAAPITRSEIETAFAERIEIREAVTWEERDGAVKALRQRRLGALVLEERPLAKPAPEAVSKALLEALRRRGIEVLPWTPAARQLQARVVLLRRIEGSEAWPDWSDAALAETLADWLEPHLAGVTRLEAVQRLDLESILAARLDWTARRRLDALAPTHLPVPSGNRHRLDYVQGEVPVLAVKLQEMFGATATPRIAEGRVPVLLHLLSPAGRPLQVTGDLAAFWSGGYREVKAEMRGRYPKHPWPDDPLTAAPTARTKRRNGDIGG